MGNIIYPTQTIGLWGLKNSLVVQSVQHVVIGREINPCFMHDSVLMLVLILLVSLKTIRQVQYVKILNLKRIG